MFVCHLPGFLVRIAGEVLISLFKLMFYLSCLIYVIFNDNFTPFTKGYCTFVPWGNYGPVYALKPIYATHETALSCLDKVAGHSNLLKVLQLPR